MFEGDKKGSQWLDSYWDLCYTCNVGYLVRARMKVETEVNMPKIESHIEVELVKKALRATTFLGST